MYCLAIETGKGGEPKSENLLLEGQSPKRMDLKLYGITSALCEALVTLGGLGPVRWILSDEEEPQTIEELFSKNLVMEDIFRSAAASMSKHIPGNYLANAAGDAGVEEEAKMEPVTIIQRELLQTDKVLTVKSHIIIDTLQYQLSLEEDYAARLRVVIQFLESVHKSYELSPWQFENRIKDHENQIIRLFYPSYLLILENEPLHLNGEVIVNSYLSSFLWPLALKEARFLKQHGVFGKICVVCNKVFPCQPKNAPLAKVCSAECRKKWAYLRLLNQCGSEEGVRAYWREKRKKKGGDPDVETTGER